MWICLTLLNCILKMVDVNFICYKKDVDGSLGKLLNSAKRAGGGIGPGHLNYWRKYGLALRSQAETYWLRFGEESSPLPKWFLGKVCWRSSHPNCVGQSCLLHTCVGVIIQLWASCFFNVRGSWKIGFQNMLMLESLFPSESRLGGNVSSRKRGSPPHASMADVWHTAWG